jgi:hypothetical protein
MRNSPQHDLYFGFKYSYNYDYFNLFSIIDDVKYNNFVPRAQLNWYDICIIYVEGPVRYLHSSCADLTGRYL